MPAVTDLLAAWLNQPRPPARDWPTPDGPDGERFDEGRDFDDRALWNYTPEFGDAMTRGGW